MYGELGTGDTNFEGIWNFGDLIKGWKIDLLESGTEGDGNFNIIDSIK